MRVCAFVSVCLLKNALYVLIVILLYRDSLYLIYLKQKKKKKNSHKQITISFSQYIHRKVPAKRLSQFVSHTLVLNILLWQ